MENPSCFSSYVRPILKPDPTTQDQVEAISRTELPVDVIHRAVKRMFEGDGDEGAVAPVIKVINLSLGDPFMHFDGRMSPLARLIDWLSVEYNVLFIVSAGNHASNILVDKLLPNSEMICLMKSVYPKFLKQSKVTLETENCCLRQKV